MSDIDVARDYNTPFKVYWNVPTKQCKSKKILFDNLEKFGIIQNENDQFEGEEITIMYDPGAFPAIFKGDSGKTKYRNGGVPQEGNLEEHLKVFVDKLNQTIPNPDFNGVGVIDFESWRPIFRQQFGTLKPYIDVSLNIEKKLHWWWPASWIKMEATKRFEDAARVFMQTTLSVAKQMRPKAVWGYYAYPYCFNMASNNMVESCSSNVKGENDRIYWLWAESTALYPSLYSTSSLSSSQLGALVRGRITEANRVKRPGTLVLPYFWFKYRDGGFMTANDVTTVFEVLKETNASGMIIWGSSNDVNKVDKCEELYDYVETVFGPIVKKYTQLINRRNDDGVLNSIESEEVFSDNSLSTTYTTSTSATLYESKEKSTNYDITTGINSDLMQNSQQTTIGEEIKMREGETSTTYTNSDTKIMTENDIWRLMTNNIDNLNTTSMDSNEILKGITENLNEATTEITKPHERNPLNNDISTTETILTEEDNNALEERNDDYLIIVDNTTLPYRNVETTTDNIDNVISSDANDDLISVLVNFTKSENMTDENEKNAVLIP